MRQQRTWRAPIDNKPAFLALLWLSGLLWVGPVHGATLEAYGRLPLFDLVALSPDGARVAFVTTLGEERTVIIQNLANPADTIRIRAGEDKIRALSWAGTGHLLIVSSQALGFVAGSPDEVAALQTYDLRRRQAFAPMMWAPESWNVIAGPPMVRTFEGRTVLYLQSFTRGRMSERYGLPALFRIDLERQSAKLVDAASVSRPQVSMRWFVDADGKPVLQTTYDEESRRWSLHLMRKSTWAETLSEDVSIETPQFVALAPDGNDALLRRIEGDRFVVRRLSLEDGRWGATLPDDQTAQRYLTDPVTQRVLASVQLSARRRHVFFAAEDQRQWDEIVQSFRDEEITLESWSDDRKKIIVRVFGPKTGAGYVLVDLGAKQTSYLGNLYAGIEAADVARVVPLRYAAADGLLIDAYLTVPKGTAKGLPLIVLPHGGPAARNDLGFDWWAQALAARGYAVLQPNYRGSTGNALSFEQAGFGEWGRKMQTDLSDGVRYLASKGIADAKRVCIVGASYGGYAALAGAAFDAGVYRCAVAVSGLSDMRRHFAWLNHGRKIRDNRTMRYMTRYLGAADEKDPKLDEVSPAMHANRIGIPVLLIHGSDDSVVPFEQSDIMASALKKAGKQHELVKLKGEDHWLSRSDTRVQMLASTVKFLEAHNPVQPGL